MFAKIIWCVRALVYSVFFKKIGLLSYIGKPLCLNNVRRITIGNKVRIYPGARFGVLNKGELIIEDNVSIGQNLHLAVGNRMIIGRDTTISGNVLITDIDHEYQQIDIHIMEQPLIISQTTIGRNCFIGYGAVIQAGTSLGTQCIVGSNAVVRGGFPDYCVIVGAPAKIVKRYDSENKIWRKTNSNGEFKNAI